MCYSGAVHLDSYINDTDKPISYQINTNFALFPRICRSIAIRGPVSQPLLQFLQFVSKKLATFSFSKFSTGSILPLQCYIWVIMNICVLLLCGCGLAAVQLSYESPSDLQGLPPVSILRYSGFIPYGAYLRGEIGSAPCSDFHQIHLILYSESENCSLVVLRETGPMRRVQSLLVSNEDYGAIPSTFPIPVVFVPRETMDILTGFRQVRVNVHFEIAGKQAPVWEISGNVDSEIREEIQSFSTEDVILITHTSSDSSFLINGQLFTGQKTDIKRALCASFPTPPAACELCAPGCWEELQGNDVCDSVCDTVECRYDDGDCVPPLLLAGTAYGIGYIVGLLIVVGVVW